MGMIVGMLHMGMGLRVRVGGEIHGVTRLDAPKFPNGDRETPSQ
jgi:hypothetical protein